MVVTAVVAASQAAATVVVMMDRVAAVGVQRRRLAVMTTIQSRFSGLRLSANQGLREGGGTPFEWEPGQSFGDSVDHSASPPATDL